MTTPAVIEGAAYQADGSAIVRLGQVAVLDLQIAEAGDVGPFTPADLSARFFVQRILGRDGAVLREVEMTRVDDQTGRFTVAVDAPLLPAGAAAADLTHVVVELLEDGEDEVLSRPFSIRRLRAGLPAATISVGDADRVMVRYVGAAGLSAAQQAKDAGLIGAATGDALAAWLREPSATAGAAAAAIVAEWQALLPDAQTIYAAAQQTASDREGTAADRLVTEQKAEQTTDDRAVTEASRTQAVAAAAAASADRAQTGLDRIAGAGHAAAAAVSANQTLLLALAATGALLAAVPGDLSAAPSPFIVPEAPGLQIYTHDGAAATPAGFVGEAQFFNVAVMKAYVGPLGPVGAKVTAGLHRYEVVAAGEHLTTSGGVKLKVLPDAKGYHIEAFGLDLTGGAGISTALAAADAVAAAAGRPLFGAPGIATLNASVTHAAQVIPNGLKFSFASTGVVQTFNAPFTAGRETVFIGTLNATTGPRWGAGTIDKMAIEWFGGKARAVSGGTPFDSSTAWQQATYAAARGSIGFTYRIEFGQGIYDFAKKTTKPAAGVGHYIGQGITTQLRGMNDGSGYPDSLFEFTTGTAGSRFEKLNFYGGSASRPVKFAIYSTSYKHVNVDDCNASSFSIAAFAPSEWENAFSYCEIGSCGVGIWARRADSNNNDLNIDTVRFFDCEVPVALNPGTATRIRNCQMQASLVAPFTKTMIYAQGISGLTIDSNYAETQPTGGLAGMAFTIPTTWQLYAAIILNNSPYYTDEIGTVTTTLAQSSSNGGSVGSITNNLFATPAYYQAGAGGWAYTAGAVNYVALTGTGTGGTGTCTVVAGGIVNTTAPTGGASGTGFAPGDIVRIEKDGNSSACASVLSTGPNNSITALYMGHAAAIYAGHARSLTISGNFFSPSCAMLALYNDRAVCDPRKLRLSQNLRPTAGLDYQIIGPVTDTVKVRLGNIVNDNALYFSAPDLGLGPCNYVPPAFAFAAPPTKSTFQRDAGRFKQYPWYRFKLNAGEQVSDVLTFSIPIASSGANNSDLLGQMAYLSTLKQESAPNTRLRVALEMENGANTVMRQNYGTETVFTQVAAEGREETSLNLGTAGGTLRGKVQVIAASAGEQFVNLGGLILTIAGVSVDLFSRASFERPLQASDTWTTGTVAAGAVATKTVACLGARASDIIEISDPADMDGFSVTRRSIYNAVEIKARNVTAAPLPGWSATVRAMVHPTT